MEQKREKRIQDWPQHQAGDNPAPQHRLGREKPARYEQSDGRGRHQTATQIVEDLPSVEGRKRIRFNPAAADGHARLQPINDLPIAANPAVLPIPPCNVVARKDVEQFDICRQPDTDVAAFQQVVAQ